MKLKGERGMREKIVYIYLYNMRTNTMRSILTGIFESYCSSTLPFQMFCIIRRLRFGILLEDVQQRWIYQCLRHCKKFLLLLSIVRVSEYQGSQIFHRAQL